MHKTIHKGTKRIERYGPKEYWRIGIRGRSLEEDWQYIHDIMSVKTTHEGTYRKRESSVSPLHMTILDTEFVRGEVYWCLLLLVVSC